MYQNKIFGPLAPDVGSWLKILHLGPPSQSWIRYWFLYFLWAYRTHEMCNMHFVSFLSNILSLYFVFVSCVNFPIFLPLWQTRFPWLCECLPMCLWGGFDLSNLICTSCSHWDSQALSLITLVALPYYKSRQKIDRLDLTELWAEGQSYQTLLLASKASLVHYNLRYPRVWNLTPMTKLCRMTHWWKRSVAKIFVRYVVDVSQRSKLRLIERDCAYLE